MKPKFKLRPFLLAVGSSLLAVSSASAQTNLTWDTAPGTVGAGNGTITGGGGTWNTTNGNWTSDAGANNVAWNNLARISRTLTTPSSAAPQAPSRWARRSHSGT